MYSSILWFRHGLRLHDNPALLDAIKNGQKFYPIYIFDKQTLNPKNITFNRLKFILESLDDIDNQLRKLNGRLYVFQGDPVKILRTLSVQLNVKWICIERDCEPIWWVRDNAVREMCKVIGVTLNEHTSHTLWTPEEIIEMNGGNAPLTYQDFLVRYNQFMCVCGISIKSKHLFL